MDGHRNLQVASQSGRFRDGSAGLSLTITAVVGAPVAAIVAGYAALGVGFCEDADTREECRAKAVGPAIIAISLAVLILGLYLTGLVLLIRDLHSRSRRQHQHTPESRADQRRAPPGRQPPARINTKAKVALAFALVALLALLIAPAGLLVSIPAALLAIPFRLRSKAEILESAGRETGPRVATLWGLAAIGLLVVGVLAAVY